MGKLDDRLEDEGRHDLAVTGWPIRTAKTGTGDSDDAADNDEDEREERGQHGETAKKSH
jgi:hypothetical protein